MRYFVFLLALTLFASNLLFAYGSVSLDRTAYPIPDVDPLELWGINDVIMDGTVIDKESIQDENTREIFGFNIKVNEYFKGKQNAKIIYAKQLHIFPNFDLKKGDNALFYIRNTSEFGYVIQSHSVITFDDCDARSLIEIIPVLPNEKYPISSPTMSESYFDPCVAGYFSYDPDFFKGIVNGISPLKQMQHGMPAEMIRCYGDLILIYKYDNSPVCIKESTVVKLIERKWGISDNWIKIPDSNKAIHYDLDGGIITHIEAFSEYKNPSLPEGIKQTRMQIKIDQTQNGSLEITLPRNLIDAKINDVDDDFFVLIDGIETEYLENKTQSKRILNIDLPSGTNIVEIVGYGFYNSKLNPFNSDSQPELKIMNDSMMTLSISPQKTHYLNSETIHVVGHIDNKSFGYAVGITITDWNGDIVKQGHGKLDHQGNFNFPYEISEFCRAGTYDIILDGYQSGKTKTETFDVRHIQTKSVYPECKDGELLNCGVCKRAIP